MTTRPSVRLLLAIIGYVALVIVACWIFASVRTQWNAAAPAYAVLFGPAMALFTHESYLLFMVVSVVVFPGLAVALSTSRFAGVGAVMFVLTWLGSGWWLHRLF